MGGNAIKYPVVDRINNQQYISTVNNIYKFLRPIINGKFINIKSYESKDSFGDIDILYYGDDKLIENSTVFKTVIRNKSIMSVSWEYTQDRYVQVDFIKVKKEEFDFAYKYFSYNDLGNLIGKIAHAAGFKFGHRGLFYVLRDGNYLIDEIEITKDFNIALEFFDLYNYDHTNFYTLEDIFKFVSNSKFFKYSNYNLKDLSNKDRVRDRKRKTYNLFLKWIDDNNIETNMCLNKTEYKNYHLDRATRQFPEFAKVLFISIEKNKIRKVIKSKFNGDIVKELTGLENKELGKFISQFKSKFSDEWIRNSTIEDIKHSILREYTNF